MENKFERAYCERCDDDMDFTTRERTRVAFIRGLNVEYAHTDAYCEMCGGQVFPVSVGKLNEQRKYETYDDLVKLIENSGK